MAKHLDVAKKQLPHWLGSSFGSKFDVFHRHFIAISMPSSALIKPNQAREVRRLYLLQSAGL